MRVIVLPDADSLAEAVCGQVVGAVAETDGPVDIGLAGGSTPAAAYRRLREMTLDRDRVNWWLSDERWVPEDDPECNGRMAAENLGDLAARLIRPRYSTALRPHEAALFYEAAIRRVLVDGRSRLVLLGMGTDGHTASLFPGTTAVAEETRWYAANRVESLGMWRLTATFPLLLRAHRIVVTVSGESKAETARAALAGEGDLPISRLSEAEGEVVWLLDEPAASRLDPAGLERPLGP
ncbi:MAG: 6-phosphogluconolactonase [Acidimicrobiia bacterium]|jgi:6-phosphogluconolactonase